MSLVEDLRRLKLNVQTALNKAEVQIRALSKENKRLKDQVLVLCEELTTMKKGDWL